MPYQIQVGSQVVEFPDSVGQDEAQRILSEQFPATGEDIAGAMQDPAYKPSVDDYLKFEEFSKNKQTDWVNTIAQSVDAAAGMISGAISEGAQGAVANPLNYIEGAAQGTRQLYGLVAQSQDPASPLFKFKDLVAGTGSPESRYNQFLEARDFANTTARLERGDEGIVVPPEYTNPEFVQGVSMILDPTLALPGIGEIFGAGKLATRAVGKGAQLTGRAVAGVARPLERFAGAAERMTAEALGMAPEALRSTAATAGIAGALGIAPEAAAFAAIPAGIRTAREAGEAFSRAGENLMTQPSRIGPLEAIGAAPGANLRQRMLGVVGQYGGDAALDASLRGIAGGIEGAAVGAGLGFLSGGEEGAAAGVGSGLAQGAAGALGARGFERLTGRAAKEARAGDLGRFIDGQQDPTTKALFERVRDTHGVDAASALMDLQGLVRGKFGDVDILYRSNAQMAEKFGDNIRGVQFEQAERPTIFINADIIGKGTGDGPLYTLGHELFHALEKTTQLEGGATEIKDALVGRWVQEGDITRKLAEGAFNDAEIEARFNEYRDKLGAGNQQRADQLAQFDTIDKKAGYVASELAAEHFAGLLAGQKPDALLKGFTGITRQLLDSALTQNASRALADAAATIERTFGVKPTDSVLFPDLKQASPQVNAMLRDLLRARRKLDERITIENEGPGKVLKPQDVSNPIAAKQLVDLGVAEKMPDGSVRSLSDEEIRVREEKDTTAIRTILEGVPGARVVDGEILGRFSPQQLSAIEQSQAVSSRMKDKIRAVNAAMDAGNSLFLNYGAATRRVKNRLTGKFTSKYNSGIRLSQREVLPYSFYLSKADNPVIKAIDISKIRGALDKLTAPDGGVAAGLWDNVDGFMSDLAAYFTNLDAGEGARRSAEIFGLEKAKFLGDFVNEQEKGGRKFVRDFRLDRIGSTAPMDFRARISEDAIQKSKMRWMPAETVGDKSVINSEEGYRIISGAKHRLYGPDGKLIGIYDTQTQAERKADATQARLQPEISQQQRQAGDESRQATEAGGRNRTERGQEGQGEGGAVRQAGDVRFMAAVEADPTQPSTETIKSIKGTRSVNSLYQFDYTYKVKEPGKPSKEKTATETVSAFSIGEAKDKAKAAISKDLGKTPNVLQSTLKIEKPLVKGQFAVTELSGKKANEAAPKIVMNPSTPEKFQSMFDAVDAALESVKDSPTLGLDSDGWIKAFSRSLNGSKGSVPPAPLRLAKWVQDNASFKSFIDEGLKRNPELIQSAVNGLNALQPIHEMARQSMIHPKMVALHMFWGLLSRMLDPYNQEAGWARLTSDPKVLRLLEDSVDGKYQSTKDEWKAIVSSKMSEFPDVKIGRNAIQNANAFHEMLSRWNGRWTELADIINNPDLDGPQMRRAFNKQGFGGAGIKHKVLSFVIATLARNDVFVGDRWQVVNLWFPHLEKAAASRKAAGGDGEVFAYDKNGVPEDTTGAYKVIGGMLNSETVAETGYSLIENGMKKIAADSPWLREMLGREPQPFDIHWLTWNIIKNEPVGHSSLDATGKFLTENLYGDPQFAQKFADTEKRTEKYAKGVFDVFSVKGQERPQIRQRSSSQYAGSGEAGIRPDAVGIQGGFEGPSAAGTAGEVAGEQRYMPAGAEAAPKHYENVDSFREHWNSLGVRNMTDIRAKGTPYEHIRPSEIEVDKASRNKGLGTAFMEDLVAFADLTGKQIRINPSDELGATSKGRLEKFYKRFGFVENKPGKNKDYAISERFYRQPSSGERFMPASEDIRFMPDYSGEHKAPQRDYGAPLDNLKGVYPDDVYGPNAAQYYGHSSGDATDKAAARIIQATKGKPDAPVKVFRAIPKSIQSNEINPGDWITTIKSYAVDHGEGPLGGDYKILEKTVPAGDLYTNGDSIFEFGYDPKFMPETIQRDVGRNQDFANPPTDTEAVDALSSEKKAKFGAARSIKPGTQVAARIDIPAFLRTGKYVVAVHEPDGAAGGPGKVIGYDTVTRLQNPKFVVKPGVQRIYEGKSAKFPVATVDGKIMADRSIPADLENYVAVGMDPKEHAFFYDKRTDQPVIGGSEAVSVGNTVFVKNPVYGKPEDFRYMPSPDSAMPGAYSFPGGYRALPGKTKGSFRIYGPAGSLLGIASSLDEAQRIIRRKNK
jgi:GNAT superfamily N-acetyltransferase